MKARNYYNNPQSGIGTALYKGYAIGAHILKTGWLERRITTRTVVGPYIIDRPNVRAADGLTTTGGSAGPGGNIEKNSVVLIIAVPPRYKQTHILGNSEFYLDISRKIQAPVIVIGNDFNKTIFSADN